MKIPVYMERLGLQNVGVRVNDYVEFISLGQDGEEYAEHLERLEKQRQKTMENILSSQQSVI